MASSSRAPSAPARHLGTQTHHVDVRGHAIGRRDHDVVAGIRDDLVRVRELFGPVACRVSRAVLQHPVGRPAHYEKYLRHCDILLSLPWEASWCPTVIYRRFINRSTVMRIRHPLDVIGQNPSQLRILVLVRRSRCLRFVAPDILRHPSEHAQAGCCHWTKVLPTAWLEGLSEPRLPRSFCERTHEALPLRSEDDSGRFESDCGQRTGARRSKGYPDRMQSQPTVRPVADRSMAAASFDVRLGVSGGGSYS